MPANALPLPSCQCLHALTWLVPLSALAACRHAALTHRPNTSNSPNSACNGTKHHTIHSAVWATAVTRETGNKGA